MMNNEHPNKKTNPAIISGRRDDTHVIVMWQMNAILQYSYVPFACMIIYSRYIPIHYDAISYIAQQHQNFFRLSISKRVLYISPTLASNERIFRRIYRLMIAIYQHGQVHTCTQKCDGHYHALADFRARFLSMTWQGLSQWKKSHTCNVFPHWLRPCLTIEIKVAQL